MAFKKLNRMLLLATAAAFAASTGSALAQKKYDTGATDTEIKIGSIMPYSGPASAYGIIGKTQAAYFNKINAEGGINGRKINFISYDDGYSPPKAVEQARKLVESDEVLLIFNPLGTPSNTAIQKYMNARRCRSCSSRPAQPNGTTRRTFLDHGRQPNYQSEGVIYAKFLMKEKPNGKIGILYQNDDFGKDVLKGLKDGLGAKGASMIIAEEPYETSVPTIDSQVVALKSKGADVFVSITTPKFGAQSIKKVAELGWKPLFILNNVASSTGSVIKPAGFENAQGVISATYGKDPTDPQWKDDPGVKNFDAFLVKYFPEANRADSSVAYGYSSAQTMVHVLKMCGDNLTRANVAEAGREHQGPAAGDGAARHQAEHQRHRLCPDQPVAADEVHGRALAAVRPDHQR